MQKDADYTDEQARVRINEVMMLRRTLFSIDNGSVDLLKIVKTPSV